MLKNIFTVIPNEIKRGDVFAVTVTCHIDDQGYPRLYRCRYPDPYVSNGIPQGDRVFSFEDETMKSLFPSVNSYKDWMSTNRQKG